MTLGPLTILAPLLLLGLLAAGIPVLLHLLAKVRAPQVFFPTLRFLRTAMDKTARRRRVQHWLLLLLRMVMLALLAVVVAQPLVRAATGQLGSDRDTAVVLVLDNSVSMRLRSSGGSTRLESAKAAALAFLRRHNFQQAALIVTNGAAARTPPVGLIDRFKVIDQIETCTPGAGQADLAGAIQLAQNLLADASQPNKEIYLFTDLQSVSTGGLERLEPYGDGRTPPPSLLIVTPPAGQDPTQITNLAVTDLAIEQPNLVVGQPIIFDATVRNFSPLAQKATVRFFHDGRERPDLTQVVDLPSLVEAGAARHVAFSLTFAEPGNHSGWVQVERTAAGAATDDLPADDRRYFSLDVAGRIDALLVKQRQELDKASDAGFWLAQLLSVGSVAEGGRAGSIRLTEITADQFSPALLETPKVVISSDVAAFTAEQAEALRDFAAEGGTWMIWLGPSVELPRYNDLFDRPTRGTGTISAYGADIEPVPGGLLGGELTGFVGSGLGGTDAKEEPVFISWVADDHPMFRGLYPDPTPYRKVLVFRYAVLKRAGEGGQEGQRGQRGQRGQPGRVIARLNTGDPLVVETPVGRGRVLLFTTAALPRWTGWLTQYQGQAFAVFQMLLAASVGPRGPNAAQFQENETAVIELPAAGLGERAELSVRKPDGKEVTAEWVGPVGRSPALDRAGPEDRPARREDAPTRREDAPARQEDAPVRREDAPARREDAPARADALPGAGRGTAPGETVRTARFHQTDQTGIYQWQARRQDDDGGAAAQTPDRRGAFVVNVPADESDLRPISPRELADLMPGRVVLAGTSPADLADKIDQHRKGAPVWPYLLVAILVLLAVEAKLANRTGPTTGAAGKPKFGQE